MSRVDNVILVFSMSEDFVEVGDGGYYPLMQQINEWLCEHAGGQKFGPDLGSQDHSFGGHKHLEAPLFVGAFNYMPEEEFLAFLRTLPWERPTRVQYIVKRQHDDVFEVVAL